MSRTTMPFWEKQTLLQNVNLPRHLAIAAPTKALFTSVYLPLFVPILSHPNKVTPHSKQGENEPLNACKTP